MKASIWKEGVGKNVHKKTIKLYNRIEERVCAKKRKGILAIKGGKRKSTSICKGPVTKRIHPAVKIATDLTSLFFSKEGWKKKNGTRLSLYELVDGKE